MKITDEIKRNDSQPGDHPGNQQKAIENSMRLSAQWPDQSQNGDIVEEVSEQTVRIGNRRMNGQANLEHLKIAVERNAMTFNHGLCAARIRLTAG
jgi:hypothetical protein